MCAVHVTLSRLAVGERVGRSRAGHDFCTLVHVYIIYNSERKVGQLRSSERASQKAERTRYMRAVLPVLLQACRTHHPLLRTYAGTGRRAWGSHRLAGRGETSNVHFEILLYFCNCLISRQGPNLSTANQPFYMQDMASLYISGSFARSIPSSVAHFCVQPLGPSARLSPPDLVDAIAVLQ